MMERRIASIALPIVVVLTLASCADSPPAPDMRDHPGMATAAVPLPENDAAAVNPGPVTAVFQAKLDPLNGSGVHGSALITVTATTMTVNLTAQGHEPDKLHVQHIHGFATAAASCPPASGGSTRDTTARSRRDASMHHCAATMGPQATGSEATYVPSIVMPCSTITFRVRSVVAKGREATANA